MWTFATLATVLLAAPSDDIHVAPAGRDAAAGTAQAPVATLARARELVRARKRAGLPEGGLTVWLQAGTWLQAQALELTAADSGEPGKPIVWRAAPGAEARLVGGVTVPAAAFRPVSEAAVLARLDPAARGQVLCAEVQALLGPAGAGPWPARFTGAIPVSELFFADRRMTVARWPNDGWASFTKVIDKGSVPRRGETTARGGTFEYEGDRPARWNTSAGVWLYGYYCYDWAPEAIRVRRIDAPQKRIELDQPHTYGLGGGNPGPRRFYAFNLLEELDQPGEYVIDPASGRLYFWPPAPLASGTVALSTAPEAVVALKGASHVTLRDLTIELSRQDGVTVSDGSDVTIAACHIRNTGRQGVLLTGGQRHRVVACEIHDTGVCGAVVSGGDRRTLQPCGHEVVNNHIHRVSRRQRTYAGMVHVAGVGVRVAHNWLHDCPHQAIGLSGNDHVIEFNEIWNVVVETDDAGAFYMGRDPSCRGTVLRHNFWHHLGSKLTHGTAAIYFDDGDGGQTVYGNVFLKACGGKFGAVFCHGGHDNLVENNVFIDCQTAFAHSPWNDQRWAAALAGADWQKKLRRDVDITQPPYTTRYLDLVGFMSPPPGAPRQNHAVRNLLVGCAKVSRGQWRLEDNLQTDTDPGFVDAAALNLALRPDAAVVRQLPGFKPIPFERIGLYTDELRPHKPARE